MNARHVNNKLDDDHVVRYSDHVSSNSLKRLDLARAARFAGFFLVRPAGCTYLEVEVLYSPDKGKS